ncbi:helix-turn-helix transcriptional regulator [Paenibacillus cymbidii]|uniref:helix-turn-helix transcriptional regulator n=1 Tax=Paenibacillus cymbidii TaxID=1639034 RepID=UPI001080DAFD|nr:helix-turn-helix domain-containing protein [Paenibacillus cymbidii]
MARRKAEPRKIRKRTRFTELRHHQGKTQRTLALDFGVTENFIRSIESGRQNPEIGFAFKLARYFETTVDDLFQDLAE